MKLSPHHYLSPLSYPPRYEASLAIGRAIRDPAKRAKIEGPAAANVATLRHRLGGEAAAARKREEAGGGVRATGGGLPDAGAQDLCTCAIGDYLGALFGLGGGADAPVDPEPFETEVSV